MRTLNNIVPQKDLCLPFIEDGKVESWQSLITFEHLFDGDKLIASPEIQKILRYFYGQSRPSVVRTNYTDDLQAWINRWLCMADMKGTLMTYPLAATYEEMKTDENIVHPGEYSGALDVISFKPKEPVEKDFLAITCKWQDGLFRNDSYVLGIIADTDDLYGIIEPWVIN